MIKNSLYIAVPVMALLFHSPKNGIGVKRQPDLDQWKDVGEGIMLGQAGWPWAERCLTAGVVLDLRKEKDIGKYLMFYHGEDPGKENSIHTFVANCSIGIAWSDDLLSWDWPGKQSGNPDTLPGVDMSNRAYAERIIDDAIEIWPEKRKVY